MDSTDTSAEFSIKFLITHQNQLLIARLQWPRKWNYHVIGHSRNCEHREGRDRYEKVHCAEVHRGELIISIQI